MNNILTFDVEEWYHANYCGNHIRESCRESNFRANMYRILQLCNENRCKATFFVLGCIGENYRDIVELIAKEGHDIASHGYSHELAYNQTRAEFTEDVRKSVGILENITGRKVFGYRAPSWSIAEKNLDYLEVLEELGLKYDASIFPVKTFLYGIPDACRNIHRPVVNGKELNLYEVPTSVFNFAGKGIGYSGGFYLRFFPYFFVKTVMKSSNRCNMPTIIYLHPREIDKNERRLELRPVERFIHYFNVGNTLKKLEKMLGQFRFTSIKDYLCEVYNVNFDD